MSKDKLTFITDKDGKADVKEVKLGDEIMVHDLKFRVSYIRENPIRLSLEPVPFVKTGAVDGNEIAQEVTGMEQAAGLL